MEIGRQVKAIRSFLSSEITIASFNEREAVSFAETAVQIIKRFSKKHRIRGSCPVSWNTIFG